MEQSPKPTTPNPPPKTSGEPELEPTTEQRGPTTANREELTKHNKPTHPNEYATTTTTRNEVTSMAERFCAYMIIHREQTMINLPELSIMIYLSAVCFSLLVMLYTLVKKGRMLYYTILHYIVLTIVNK